MVVVGADEPKRSHPFVAGSKLAELTLRVDGKRHDKAARWPEAVFGSGTTWRIKDCRHLSAQQDMDPPQAGQRVVRP